MRERNQKYYLGHARHCLRFYAAHSALTHPPFFRSAADRDDFLAAKRALSSLDQASRELVLAVYQEKTPAPDTVRRLCLSPPPMREGTLWALLRRVEKRTARERGLI